MRIAFMGTPSEAVPTLGRIVDGGHDVEVFTQPDRGRGRGRVPLPPPVKEAALEAGLVVHQPPDRHRLTTELRNAGPFDLGVVVAYGQILDREALAVPRHGHLNVHFSLLPRWRGAAPVVWAILAGDDNTGVSLMQMDEGLDTGPIVATRPTPIGPEETAGELTGRLAHLGAELAAETIDRWVAGEMKPRPQDSEHATYAPRVATADAHLDPTLPAVELAHKVRAYNPRPGAWMEGEGRLKIWRAAVVATPSPGPGLVARDAEGPLLGTGEGSLRLDVVQPAGKRPMTGAEWLRGIPAGRRVVLR